MDTVFCTLYSVFCILDYILDPRFGGPKGD